MLHDLLKRHFGFDSFRPLQEEIIRDTLEGRDVFALLPTGGGKSLCFQLPALARDGLTLVISPLIALMKDQVDALVANGISATFLNSSVTPEESAKRHRALNEGKIRLLYMAPERLMIPGVLDQVRSWNVKLFAVDEAHCISEWGHDFRPDYRQLMNLRALFPQTPVMALTATATGRVRKDIIRLLGLANGKSYVASFNRPNLIYRVRPKSNAPAQVLSFLRERSGESGIVYCASRQGCEDLADRLAEAGIKAKAYHAGLSIDVRSRHQEEFLRDDVTVICATIAFGMGINKSNVRFVVHYDLPKNIEGYYQETGRAGRDGLASECLLLFNPGDVQKQLRFINEKSDPVEQQVAHRQLQDMVHYAETTQCRRAHLLGYFGEGAPSSCEACDNCLTPRSRFDGTIAAQKFLSCVVRIRQKSGFSVGLNHVVDVLRGAKSEKIERWGHDTLSTYAIGKEFGKREWQALGRELLRMGFVAQSEGTFATLDVTPEGRTLLAERRSLQLTQPMLPTARERREKISATSPVNETLFQRLRQLRRTLADSADVPAYIVFSDATLREMAARAPQTLEELSRVNGVGEKKLKAYGEAFLEEIRSHGAT